jgi:rubrerythrin
MSIEAVIARSFMRSLVSHPAGRAHVLSLMVAAEEGDEVGVFDQLIRKADDPELAKLVRRHKEDEERHAAMYRACLARNGLAERPIDDRLLIIREVGREAGGAFAAGLAEGSADGIATREDVMNTYAVLLAIEERGVERFPLIGAEFRRIGDHETADTFDRITADEVRHTKYCAAIGRRYAPDEATWQRAVEKHRAIEARAFARVGIAGMAYALENGLAWRAPLARLAGRLLRATSSPLRRRASPCTSSSSRPAPASARWRTSRTPS